MLNRRMAVQNVGWSCSCSAVKRSLLLNDRMTSSRTEITVRNSSSATVRIGRQLSQSRRYGMKYMPDSRQNCRPHLVRVASSQPTTTKITMVESEDLPPTHSRLVSHSRRPVDRFHGALPLAIQECAHPNRTVPGYGTVLK